MTLRQKTTGLSLLVVAVSLVGVSFAVNQFAWQSGDASADNAAAGAKQNLAMVELLQIEFHPEVRVTREFSGAFRASRSSELGFKRTGRLETVRVEQGDVVQANDVLAELDTEYLLSSLAELRSQRDGAAAMLAELMAGPRQQTIAAARADVQDLQAQLELAIADFERRERLKGSGAISMKEYDDAKTLVRSIEQRLEASSNRLSELEEGTRAETIAAQQAEVARLEAAIQRIEVEIRESKLVAPYDAIISQRLFDEGSIVGGGQSVFRLVEKGSIEAWIGLPPDFIAELEVGRCYPLSVDKRVLSGKLKSILPELDSVTRTRTARFLVIDELPPQLMPAPGQLVRVKLEQSISQSGCWVPTKALVRGQRGLWSIIVAKSPPESQRSVELENLVSGERQKSLVAEVRVPEGRFQQEYLLERRDIEVLQIDTDRVFVRGAIVDGERFVANGVHRLTAGQRVQGQIAEHVAEVRQ
ncbi:MAG TPA: HlyD family efflux transporter periplasmic adaptor subunit [Pirellulaceae bacterium]|nr:HlyD family efflux transporter periplasmic adaptor subunit [Pirellulaceae bacterium]HMO91046.1 HlyD family efflux transporter periplasmic adaptor subunit [Pirellulaceae bacterium]HMP68161.1 HlyD family efflux transporter periplasmic adaptor subunit [Pirellulaceae bacterium]